MSAYHAVYTTVGSDVKEGTGTELSRPWIPGPDLDIVEVVVMVAQKLAPPIDPFIEIVEEEDSRERVETIQAGIGDHGLGGRASVFWKRWRRVPSTSFVL